MDERLDRIQRAVQAVGKILLEREERRLEDQALDERRGGVRSESLIRDRERLQELRAAIESLD